MPGLPLPPLLRHRLDRGAKVAPPSSRPHDDLASLAAAVCGAAAGTVVLDRPGGRVLSGCHGLLSTAAIALDRGAGESLTAPAYCAAEISIAGRPIGAVGAVGFDPGRHGDRQRAALGALARQAARQLELERLAAELHVLAITDPLTEVGNRRLLEAALEARLNDPDADGVLGIVFCDVDDFKRINDGHGHDAGDRLLRRFALELCAIAGDEDVVARIAGDEFVLACPHLPHPAALDLLADRIRAIGPRPLHPGRRPVRISAGAALAQPGDSARDLLRRADAAMYGEKAAHRALGMQACRLAGARPLRTAETLQAPA